MDYPSMEQVRNASHEQICEWVFFLPMPYMQKIGRGKTKKFVEAPMVHAREIMKTIWERYGVMGRMTPEIRDKLWIKYGLAKEVEQNNVSNSTE
jgi:hypothetical protein